MLPKKVFCTPESLQERCVSGTVHICTLSAHYQHLFSAKLKSKNVSVKDLIQENQDQFWIFSSCVLISVCNCCALLKTCSIMRRIKSGEHGLESFPHLFTKFLSDLLVAGAFWIFLFLQHSLSVEPCITGRLSVWRKSFKPHFHLIIW